MLNVFQFQLYNDVEHEIYHQLNYLRSSNGHYWAGQKQKEEWGPYLYHLLYVSIFIDNDIWYLSTMIFNIYWYFRYPKIVICIHIYRWRYLFDIYRYFRYPKIAICIDIYRWQYLSTMIFDTYRRWCLIFIDDDIWYLSTMIFNIYGRYSHH